jgi:hypothetical protein
MKKTNALQIISSKIVVSANHLSAKGYYVSHEVKGILPGCRKVATLSITPMLGYVWVKNLWSYNGKANIAPADWAALINTSPVVSATSPSFQYPLTPEVIKDAYADALRVTNCPAITDRSHVHPNYTGKTEFNPLVVVNRA